MPKPQVLFVHGYASSGAFVNALRTQKLDFDILTISLAPPELPDSWTVAYYAKLVREFIERENLTSLIVVGHSLGGAIVSHLHDVAAIKHFILLAPLHPLASGDRSSWLLPASEEEAKEAYVNLAHNPDLLNSFQLAFAAKQYYAHIQRHFAGNERLVHAQIQDGAFLTGPLVKAYEAIKKRATLIIGDDDAYVNTDLALMFARKLNLPAHVISECGHSPIWERPSEVAKVINDVIKLVSV